MDHPAAERSTAGWPPVAEPVRVPADHHTSTRVRVPAEPRDGVGARGGLAVGTGGVDTASRPGIPAHSRRPDQGSRGQRESRSGRRPGRPRDRAWRDVVLQRHGLRALRRAQLEQSPDVAHAAVSDRPVVPSSPVTVDRGGDPVTTISDPPESALDVLREAELPSTNGSARADIEARAQTSAPELATAVSLP